MYNETVQSYYPANWPSTPFHPGEIQVQHKLGVQELVNGYAPKIVRPYMPDQHREFYQAQPFVVAAAKDSRGLLWSTLLFSSDGSHPDSFVTSPDPTRLRMTTRPLSGDALEGALQPGSDLGLLGIEFATRRRNRVNGRILTNGGIDLEFQVEQSFGNCPQYIKPREWWVENTSRVPVVVLPNVTKEESSSVSRPNTLTIEQMEQIREAESVFVATGYRGEGEDPRYGNDSSHRGGSAGFLDVDEDGRVIVLPDYNGNNIYNTIGNLMMDTRMGLTIPLYETGGMIQLTGTAYIVWDDDDSIANYPGAKRLIVFQIQEVVGLEAGSLPIRWNEGDNSLKLQVSRKVEESADVTSFYLSNALAEGLELPPFKAGQHLPVTLQLPLVGTVDRSYSLSSFGETGSEYRISVKREPRGAASKHFHDRISVGDEIVAHRPTGGFIYEPSVTTDLVLFLSAGIGVTPILAMLQAFVKEKDPTKKALWIHTARDAEHHPFLYETATLSKNTSGVVTSFLAYTRESPDRSSADVYGRITTEFLADKVNPERNNVQVYMCGPQSFIGDMETALENIGVDPNSIQFETF